MFLSFGIKDLIDILLVATLLYYAYRLMKESRSLNIFFGVLIFIVFWLFVSQILEMRLLGTLLDRIVSVGAIALLILFQDEIRKFFSTIGTHERVRAAVRFFSGEQKQTHTREDIMPIVMACLSMSKQKVGALIVMQRSLPLTDFVRSGELIDARISQRLIENIFFKNSPLHDGGMIISHKRITAAGCILPVSHDLSLPKELGLRHRAAMGISQETDALAIVVSEETGNISIAFRGSFQLHVTAEDLERILTEDAF
ncbi:MAG: diadenylate cyclase CdaA [Bacteroidaceae bacterium]|nr:diadenylate cyclase CdaA [Bacteroidaceae bacterium]MBQ8937925.1 diadenylate cyclase CdaA [Bacteroidaceae bacterium]MBQ9190007.1 diadenylate cyclase CdaA [Bacteroidaceae bacterium]MBR0243862.1 diadenylate cyclase CdaA [Bacteroidaceae bacterium]MBR1755862.1 diadenylate cyclase CdaA [Bacteroidaceae bacterium]